MYQDTRHLLSQAKFFEGYSRYNDDLQRYETWDEAVDRVMHMHREYYKEKMTPELEKSIDFATKIYKEQGVLGAQRALQFGGEQIIKHQMKMYNCTATYADRTEFFSEIFYIGLCGCGAGFSVQKHHVEKLPHIILRTKAPKIHSVDDSIEGWADALAALMSSFFEEGQKFPEYRGHRIYFDLTKIRPKGSKISGGFKAPGPDSLRIALDRIEYILQGVVLSKKKAKLTPIQVYDIVMHAMDAVISGGVRRSASICIFSPDDEEMMNAKTGNWGKTNPQRARSNNSALLVRSKTTKEQFAALFKRTKEFGEPAFIWAEDEETVFNPCVEIGMFPQFDGVTGWQGCNLTEINGSQCTSLDKFLELCEAGSIIGTLQAGYTDFKYLTPVSKKIFERESLIGVSITGWMCNPKILFNEEYLKAGAEKVKEINKNIAKLIGINPAARTTCVKPSGNASVLLKTAAGIHPEHSPLYIRNIQINKENEVAAIMLRLNPDMIEESVWSDAKSDYIISFPIVAKKNSLYKDDIKGIKHLDLVKLAQRAWVETGTNIDLCVNKTVRHNVSNTVIADDWDAIENYVFENKQYFAGISFLGNFGDKDFNQAPNTRIETADIIVKKYGTGSMFASGLIVDAINVFDNLWDACSTAKFVEVNQLESVLQKDWVRRFKKYSKNYFNEDDTQAEYCLKDVYLLHKWERIQHNMVSVDWTKELKEKKFTDIDTTGAAACAGVNERGELGCFI